jgi:putative ABC transport system permease protein
MGVIWYKVWFDLWKSRGRTLLVILSIASGVFAIGGIFGMVDLLISGMDASHRDVNPSHINIILRNFVDADIVDDLKTMDGVEEIDPVNQISVRYRTSDDEPWKLGTLVMRDYDEQVYDQFVLKEGDYPTGLDLGMERMTGQYFDIEIGDAVTFEIDGEPTAFTVQSQIRHPFVQPPQFGGQAHFFVSAEGLEEFGIPEGQYGQLLVRVDEYSLERSQEIAGDIRERLGEQGLGVLVTLYQDPDRHWGRMFVEGVNLILQIMAIVSLFLSVVLVLNTMTAIITQQTDQIGILKSIGGRSSVVARIYLVEVFVYGMLALIISLPLGVALAYGMTRWFLILFNIDYPTIEFSIRAITYQVVAALVAPALAALIPILKGARITVREAIASYGIGGDFGSNGLDRFVERVGSVFLSTPYAAALGNMFRRKGRLVLTLLVLSTAGVMFLIVMSLISSTTLTLDNDMARRGYDFRIGFTRNQPSDDLVQTALDVEGVTAAEVWFSRNATILRAGERLQDSAGLGAQLIGLPAESEFYQPIITSGRWFEAGDENVIVLSGETAEKNNIAVGDTINLNLGELGNSEWEVIGTYRVVYGGGFVIDAIYAPLEAVYDATGVQDEGTQIYIQTDRTTTSDIKQLSDDLRAMYEAEDKDIDLYTTSIVFEERDYANNQFQSVIGMFLGLAMLVATVGGIGLMGALGISVMERQREIGVMRSIGANNRQMMTIFIMEGVLQGLVSWLVSIPLAYIIAAPLARALGQTMLDIDLDYAFNTPAVFIWLAMILVISISASWVPARQAARMSVRESLQYS